MVLIHFVCSLACPVTIRTFLFTGAYLPPGMDTVLSAAEIAAKPPAVAKAFQGNAAVLTADAVVIAYTFVVFTGSHS
jgi:hypothetical protein